MRGNGVSGVLWSMEAGGLSRATMFFLDFTRQFRAASRLSLRFGPGRPF